jgi:hypothetical protein
MYSEHNREDNQKTRRDSKRMVVITTDLCIVLDRFIIFLVDESGVKVNLKCKIHPSLTISKSGPINITRINIKEEFNF